MNGLFVRIRFHNVRHVSDSTALLVWNPAYGMRGDSFRCTTKFIACFKSLTVYTRKLLQRYLHCSGLTEIYVRFMIWNEVLMIWNEIIESSGNSRQLNSC